MDPLKVNKASEVKVNSKNLDKLVRAVVKAIVKSTASVPPYLSYHLAVVLPPPLPFIPISLLALVDSIVSLKDSVIAIDFWFSLFN